MRLGRAHLGSAKENLRSIPLGWHFIPLPRRHRLSPALVNRATWSDCINVHASRLWYRYTPPSSLCNCTRPPASTLPNLSESSACDVQIPTALNPPIISPPHHSVDSAHFVNSIRTMTGRSDSYSVYEPSRVCDFMWSIVAHFTLNCERFSRRKTVVSPCIYHRSQPLLLLEDRDPVACRASTS